MVGLADAKRLFGAEIRRRRQAAGLSQEELAERAKLHRTFIGRIERGETNVTLFNILRLANSLSVTPSQLLANFG